MARNRRRNHKVLLEEEPSKTGNLVVEIILWIVEIAAAILLGFLLVRYGAEKMTISGNSMETVLSQDDSVIIDKLTGKIRGYKRFDVIAFQQNGKEHDFYNVKRIVGLPGEKVRISDGKLYINDELLEDKFSTEEMSNAGMASKEILLEENEYFVLGDNRNGSEDSRFANVGNVVKSEIIGRVFLRISPGFAIVPLLEPEKAEEEKEKA